MEYIVNRDQGWPVDAPQFSLLDVVELEADEAAEDVEKGYLVAVDPKNRYFTPEMATKVVAHRQRKAEQKEAAEKDQRDQDEARKKEAAAFRKMQDEQRKNPPKDVREEQVRAILGAGATEGPPPPPPASVAAASTASTGEDPIK